MRHSERTMTDLRVLAGQRLGPPLAASRVAALWRCPFCPPEHHALLWVAADACCCLGSGPCDADPEGWLLSNGSVSADPVLAGVLA